MELENPKEPVAAKARYETPCIKLVGNQDNANLFIQVYMHAVLLCWVREA